MITRTIIKFTALFLFSIITSLCASCHSPRKPRENTTHPSPITIGDSVAGFKKSVLVIYQDTKNIYWFGSHGDGVYRYDATSKPGTNGNTMLRFTTKDGLCNDSISEIKEDAEGNIYFNTLGGINKFDGQKLTTLPVLKAAFGNEWKHKPGDLWFKGKQGSGRVFRYDGYKLFRLEFPKHFMEDEYFRINGNKSWSPYDVYHIYRDREENIWFGTSNFGLCRFDGKTISWMYEDHLTNVKNGGSFGIRSIFEDTEHKFWICNNQYRYEISPGDSVSEGYHFLQYKKEKLADEVKTRGEDPFFYFMSIVEDKQGVLWLATYGNGVYRYDPSTPHNPGEKKFINYPVMHGDKVVTLFSVYKDNHGDLWLGTHEYGAWKFDGKEFVKFMP